MYLYFVSTESQEINKLRVKRRKEHGGHDVPPELMESRYYRSLDFLYNAWQLACQVFIFGNSAEGKDAKMFGILKY